MAAVALLGAVTFNTTAGTKTVTATPTAGDLIVIVTGQTAGTINTAPTDNQGGTYTLLATKLGASQEVSIWARNSLVSSGVSTIYTHAPGATTGGGLAVLRVTGMVNTGGAAVRNLGVNNSGAGTTPDVTITGVGISTANPLIGAVLNASNPATITPPAGFTERFDGGYNTPTTGMEVASRDSGHSGTSVTWGSTSGSAWFAVAIELDTGGKPVDETAAATDTVSAVAMQAVSESAPAADTVAHVITYHVGVTEAAAASDSQSADTGEYVAAVSESSPAADAVDAIVSKEAAVAESAPAADTVSQDVTLSANIESGLTQVINSAFYGGTAGTISENGTKFATTSNPSTRYVLGGKGTGKWYFEFSPQGGPTPERYIIGVASTDFRKFSSASPASHSLGWDLFSGEPSGIFSGVPALTPSYTGTRPVLFAEWARVAVDLDTGKVWFGNATSWWGDPEAGTDPVWDVDVETLVGIGLTPWLRFSGTGTKTLKFNFGAEAFQFTPPAGFAAWDTRTGAQDDVSEVATFDRTIEEAGAAADSVDASVGGEGTFDVSVAEALTLADTQAQTTDMVASITEAAEAAEAVSAAADFAAAVAESAPASDSVDASMASSVAIEEAVEAVDTVTQATEFPAQVEEQASASDTVSALLGEQPTTAPTPAPGGSGDGARRIRTTTQEKTRRTPVEVDDLDEDMFHFAAALISSGVLECL